MNQAMSSAPILETPSGKNAASENFPVGSWLIRRSLRGFVHDFYRFARAADDIADNPLLGPADKISALERYAAVLQGADDVATPAAMAMRESLRHSGVSQQHCHDLLTAFRRDATQLRYRDWDDLLEYCRYSAAPVGRYLLDLHGTKPSAWPANDALCAALQIINHLQDCADDYRTLDRVYIPADYLALYHADVTMLAAAHSPEPLRAVLDALLDQLEPLLNLARTLPRQIPAWRLRAETAIIVALAEALVKQLRQRDPLAEAVKLNKWATAQAVMRGLCVRLW
jgi:hydroxysqualene synthase